jgi:hypothetical protein
MQGCGTGWLSMKIHRTLLGAGAGVALSVVLGVAQSTEEKRPDLVFEHDGHDVRGFVLYARPEQGQEIRVDLGPVSGDSAGRRSVALPNLPPGTYTLSVAAYNAAGESARAAAAPGRISVAVEDGGDSPRTVSTDTGGGAVQPGGSRGIFGRIWRVVVGD